MARSEVAAGIEAACSLGTATVVVRPWEIAWAKHVVGERGPLICTSISFPHGADATISKVGQTRTAIESGADEIDVVMNIGALLSGQTDLVFDEISAVVEAARPRPVKVIIETGYLDRDGVVAAARLVAAAGAAYVKNGTGYSPRGATPEETRLLRQTVPVEVLVKAAGGIRTLAAMLELIEAGAARIGTSASAAIADEWRRAASSENSPGERRTSSEG
ncbi:MAG: deoxyribose-phosphate aldolase [Chloroflexota bacterium]|nr:deoxyribose-phosphate aldolase [Chloroflexota bacterium]